MISVFAFLQLPLMVFLDGYVEYLTERSLPNPEDPVLNPVLGPFIGHLLAK